MTQSFIIGANNNPNAFKLIAYEVSAPNTPVDILSIPLPHTSSQNATFLTLNEVAHIVRLYEWTGSTLGANIWSDIVQSIQKTIETPADIELVVGVDLTAGGTQWDGFAAYPEYKGYLIGIDFRVEQRGIGTLKNINEIINYGDFGFELQGGAIFNDGDTFFIQFLPKIVVNPANNSSNSKGFEDIVTLNNSEVLDITYLNKLIDINHFSDTIAQTFELPPIINWTDMSSIGFISDKGLQVNSIIKLAAGEIVFFNGIGVNEIYIGNNEYLKIIKKGSQLYVENSTIKYNDVGHFEKTYLQLVTNDNKNYVSLNGSLLQRNVYVRLWDYVQKLTIGQGVVAEANWNANKALFSLGDGSTTFRVPEIADVLPIYNLIKI